MQKNGSFQLGPLLLVELPYHEGMALSTKKHHFFQEKNMPKSSKYMEKV